MMVHALVGIIGDTLIQGKVHDSPSDHLVYQPEVSPENFFCFVFKSKD